jgi:hypothetical protein
LPRDQAAACLRRVSVIRNPALFGQAEPSWIPALWLGNTILLRADQYCRQLILADILSLAISEESFAAFIKCKMGCGVYQW